jgi:phosphoribosylaminoimidazolecarboxamide formyltransferase/IMP cyclohydrolase
VLIAPSYSEEAIAILTAKKNRIILVRKEVTLPGQQFKTLLNGVILQDKDNTMQLFLFSPFHTCGSARKETDFSQN